MSKKDTYIENILSEFKKEFGLTNKMETPSLTKIVVNMGVGEVAKNRETLSQVSKDLANMTGQKPSTRLAKLSVASFGLREGMPVGLKVTLRGKRMYSFLEKLNSIVLPRLRDFRGVSLKSFDKSGNYNLGLADYSVFPEIDVTKGISRGMEITMVTSGNDPKKAKRLLELLGVPFGKEG